METAKTKYKGDLRTEIVHLRSGSIITTDAPVDNKGKGKTSPRQIWLLPHSVVASLP
jgi:hypothetical protein